MKKTLKLLPVMLLIIIATGCEKTKLTGSINGHDYVDLGLPSGLKWATCNMGASLPSDYGDYYAWGETTTKSSYTKSNCATFNQNISDISGNPQYDAARANWGSTWRLPQQSEVQELIDNCTWTWTTQEGHNGYIVTGPNGQSIFMPAAGVRGTASTDDSTGEIGIFWTSTPYENNLTGAYVLGFYHSLYWAHWDSRHFGISIRPVSE